MEHQYFVERQDGIRQPLTGLQVDILKRKYGYTQIIATNAMTVVKNISLKSSSPIERKYPLGGGRLRNPYEHIGA